MPDLNLNLNVNLKLNPINYGFYDSNDGHQPNTVLNSSLRLRNIVNFFSNSPDGLLNNDFIFAERMGERQPNILGATETQTIPGDVTRVRSRNAFLFI
jgi:hypothetical protein